MNKNVTELEKESFFSEDIIFHYTKASTAIECILSEMALRFSSFKHLDDPQEYKKWTHATGTGWETTKEDMFKAMGDLMKELHNCKVGCFSLNSDDGMHIPRKGFAKSRMWSQYTEGHRGVCLAFSREKLIEQVEESLEDGELILCSDKVQYRPELPVFDDIVHIDVNEYKEKGDEYLKGHISKNAPEAFFRKQLDYEQELEYRIVIKANRDKFCTSIDKSLTGIILGDRFHLSYLPSLQELLIQAGIEIPIRKLSYNLGGISLIQS